MPRDPIQPVVTSAPRSRGSLWAEMFLAVALVLLALGGVTTAHGSGFEFAKVQGHASFGYGHIMVGHSPAGSIGVTVGFEHPAAPNLDLGLDLGLFLYGSRNMERGSLNATLDYSSIDLIAMTHWRVPFGPVSRLSAGAGLASARAELSASAGGAEFLDTAVDDVGPALALDLTVMQRRVSPVRVAAVAGWRSAFLDGEDWHQFSVRLGFHY